MPAEEHDFGQQEQPHAEAAGFALLLFGFEVMAVLRQRRPVMTAVSVSGLMHDGFVRHELLAIKCCDRVDAIVLANGRHLFLRASFRATRSRRLRASTMGVSAKFSVSGGD